MFDIGSSELLLIVVVAVVVIGPKDLPRALYKLGQIIGKGRAMTRHFRAGLDAMIREAELEELEKKWAAENARIMAEHPQVDEAAAGTETPEDQTAPAAEGTEPPPDDAPAGQAPEESAAGMPAGRPAGQDAS